MSIVNDALKKARKDFEFNDQKTSVGDRHACPLPNSEKKWTALITVSLALIASLFGSLVLYKNLSGFNNAGSADQPAAMQTTLNSVEQKIPARGLKRQDAAKLSGIMYGKEGKWAIVDNRIIKEGDSLLGGQVASITRDMVKIEKKDGSEIVLNLK
ncbi:MAG: hypothetical protein Q8N76_06055 [Candidatus Omnitrophota bacterium]|nr:hypothetical protein [Candidatus Omnitrophota bacterium]